eukprot:TRINITY_DN401_c0_g1_i2.p1 TRINITY_DN401_c0_g1~~TRINITY_DN401_c0_g1_i2.p1  ORF type:complete len:263 (-),score=50.63 TRINITY_DN401_c0_g1_i2:293-1081(-)
MNNNQAASPVIDVLVNRLIFKALQDTGSHLSFIKLRAVLQLIDSGCKILERHVPRYVFGLGGVSTKVKFSRMVLIPVSSGNSTYYFSMYAVEEDMDFFQDPIDMLLGTDTLQALDGYGPLSLTNLLCNGDYGDEGDGELFDSDAYNFLVSKDNCRVFMISPAMKRAKLDEISAGKISSELSIVAKTGGGDIATRFASLEERQRPTATLPDDLNWKDGMDSGLTLKIVFKRYYVAGCNGFTHKRSKQKQVGFVLDKTSNTMNL